MEQKQKQDILTSGEHESLECKPAREKIPKSLWETYSAFANTSGGLVLLGVEEKGDAGPNSFRVVGVQKADRMRKDIWNTLNNRSKISRNVLSNQDVGITSVDGSDVLWIQVPAAPFTDRPVYCGDNPFRGTFKRNFEGDYRCSEEEVRRMLRDAQSDGDAALLTAYTLDDLDSPSVAAYRSQFRALRPGHTWSTLSDETFLRMLHVYELDPAGKPSLTVAGLLMFGKGTAVSTQFPNVKLDFFDKTYAGTEVRWRDRVTYDGTWEFNLYNFAFQVMPRLMRGLAQPFQMDGIVRQDDTPVHQAVREALINTLVHCDFRLNGTVSIIKDEKSFFFRNPGPPLIPIADIYAGGEPVTQSPHSAHVSHDWLWRRSRFWFPAYS